MSDRPTCCALVSSNYMEYRCAKPAKYWVGHYGVCGTHRLVAEKWAEQGRLDSMVQFWWIRKQKREQQ